MLFALAYLVVVAVYLGLIRAAFPREPARTIWQIAPYNLGSVGLLVVAGFVEGPADWWLWTAAVALQIVQHEVGRFGRFPFFSELLEHPLGPLSLAGAAFLAGGAVTYVLGVTAVRQSVAAAGVRQWIAALAAAVVCGVSWWIGTFTAALVEVGLLAIALLALTAFTHRLR